MYFLYPLFQARIVHCIMWCSSEILVFGIQLFSFFIFFVPTYKRFTLSSQKTTKLKKLRNDDHLSYNHARQAKSRDVAQTMESRVRYGTYKKLHVVLYTSRELLFAVLCQPSERMDDDTTRGTSLFPGIYVGRQPTSTRTTSNVFSFSCTFIVNVDWSRQSHRYSRVKIQ